MEKDAAVKVARQRLSVLEMAETLVKAAEGLLGRYTGDEKFAKVCEWFEARGIKANDAVKQMIYNTWLELNTQMIELGLKEGSTSKASETSSETDNRMAEDTGSTADDPFADTDEAVRLE